jgi:hypothetical protein
MAMDSSWKSGEGLVEVAFVNRPHLVFIQRVANGGHQMVGRYFNAIDVLFIHQFISHIRNVLLKALELLYDFRFYGAFSQPFIQSQNEVDTALNALAQVMRSGSET